MALGTRRTPERNSPLLGGVPIVKGPVATITVGSGTTPLTLTAAEVLVGLLPVNCTDTGTLTLPTAALLVAAMPGIAVGNYFEFNLINFGDSTVTVAVGTGITAKVIDSATAVLTTATNYSNRYFLVCTGVAANGSSSDSFDLYGMGTTAAAVA
jgi:hypothetical protein